MERKPNVGGQAVIEGVMMRGAAGNIAVAVRQPNGEIIIDKMASGSIADKYPILKKPFLRGVVVLCESLVLGMKALSYSAQVSGDIRVFRSLPEAAGIAGAIAASLSGAEKIPL